MKISHDHVKIIVELNCGSVQEPKPLSRVQYSIKIWQSQLDDHIKDSKNTIGTLEEKREFREGLRELIRQARIIENTYNEQLQLL